MKNPKVSIIIRTKNEERWISSCLRAIYDQTYKDFEIIIVDNNSKDKTIEKAKNHLIKNVIYIDDYLPGKALNIGIENSIGEYFVCISAHCVPTNKYWLETLVNSIEEDKKFAGVYGRQEPMAFSTLSDKRDLLIVFGLDRKIQKYDSFFHNANSIVRRELWEKTPFDNSTTNIEDRLWAQEMLNLGYKLMYEPKASVYHYHGIHQDGNIERLKNVVNIIEKKQKNYKQGVLEAEKLNIVAVIPVKGESNLINGKPQLGYTIEAAKKSKYVNEIIISTDSKKTQEIANEYSVSSPFLRPSKLSAPYVNLEDVQKFSLEEIEKIGIYPDLIVHMEETYPFRPDKLIDDMIITLLNNGYDSVVAAKRESGWLWQEDERGDFVRVDSGDVPRDYKEKSLLGLHGLCCVTYPEFVREGIILGRKTGLYEVDDLFSGLEIRGKKSISIAKDLLNNYYSIK
jgi:rhamnosyltransferase